MPYVRRGTAPGGVARVPHGARGARHALSRHPLALLTACAAAVLPVALPAAPAHAQERTVSGGRLDWGIKSSFQSYVTGPIANGRWNLTGGAATTGESQFRFHSAKGGYDPDTGSFRAAFSGGVHFTGHRKGGSNVLDLTVANPTVRVTGGGSGTLYADLRSKDRETGRFSDAAQVPLASLDLSGVNMRGGTGPITLQRVPATLTARGAKAFAGYYKAGTRLDPVNLSADVRSGGSGGGQRREEEKKKEKKEKKEGKQREGKQKEDAKGRSPGRIEDAAVDWGVRRTFREYVTGAIAKGEWKLTQGARDGGALFRFPRGKGEYDAGKGALDADFAGAVRFTGKDLDLSLSGLSVRVRDGEGTLSADVTSDGRTARDQPLVTFAAKESALKPEHGLITLTETPATLTAEGSKAFAGMYAKGTKMDPLSLAVALDDQAKLPALPDLGSGADTENKDGSGDASSAPKAENASDSGGSRGSSSALPLAATGAGVAVLLAAGTGFALARRRRKAPAGSGADTGADTHQ
ncbi:HtaA domain-containing protein [Streptomyces boncukensis]|uniref:Htaa domain protein n=1 Tax=Streptomyces boncukensis TaxID=2711219 RepID=A0A6G4X0R9_9ACTN|nr:HtaA domain-containing protein [Streptomyces boncukensis]NGO70457.1 Htaa domain protein [Streptomyces boncukensis]